MKKNTTIAFGIGASILSLGFIFHATNPVRAAVVSLPVDAILTEVNHAPVLSVLTVLPVSPGAVTFGAMIDAQGMRTNYWFEYGTDPAVASSTSTTTPHSAAGRGKKAMLFEASAIGLSPATTYYFRAVAENFIGATRGEIRSFTTK